jgi:hypothetical protein
MSNTNTGGPAFPAFEHHPNYGQMLAVGGMTLRDYFAAKAMAADMTDGIHENDFAWAAARAYKVADAMLKAREA